LFLSGHLHQSHSSTTQRYAIEGHSALVVQSGTSTSTRGRGESNAFNVLRIEPDLIRVETLAWQSARGAFELARSTIYSRGRDGWSQDPALA
ncbi:MAG TPA: metallophosphoesterase, partial [Luteimonas sp.]|nr:metallophosphoesterase [Luteimonas sp.]